MMQEKNCDSIEFFSFSFSFSSSMYNFTWEKVFFISVFILVNACAHKPYKYLFHLSYEINSACLYKFAFILYRYVKAGTIMNNYAHIFDLLTRLRQVNDNCSAKLK